MGKKNKMTKFAEIGEFKNVYEHGQAPKGKWNEAFPKKQPLFLELACGKGEYTLGLAKLHPEKNFLGLDIKGNRIWKGAKTALEDGIDNAAFLRCQINRITDYFEPGEVSAIWITFPDPQPRDGKAKKRLTHPNFLKQYKQISNGSLDIHLKTDSQLLYDYTLEVIEEEGHTVIIKNNDVYSWDERPEELDIQTFYENIWRQQGITTKYIHFKI